MIKWRRRERGRVFRTSLAMMRFWMRRRRLVKDVLERRDVGKQKELVAEVSP